MANGTGGTNGTTTLTAQQFSSGSTPSDADIASLSQAILQDRHAYPWPNLAGAWARTGLLYVPNRGVLKLFPGDWVMVDPAGWPICIAGDVLPATLTATGTPISATTSMVMTASVLAKGWSVGMIIAGTGLVSGTKIANISSDGLTVTLSSAATSSPGATTITASNWTHS